jgi:hypothetical protein
MSNPDAGKDVTRAIASSSSGDISRIVDAANSSKEKRRENAAIKARREAEEKKKSEEAAVRIFIFPYRVNILTLSNQRSDKAIT